MIVILYNIFSS